jgi:chromosome segregation ATPase
MSEITPSQKNNLKSWSEQRDTLLQEIGVYTTQKNVVLKELAIASESLTEVQGNIKLSEGRLEKMNELEELKKNSISVELSEMEARKSKLEAEIVERETRVLDLTNEEKITVNRIEVLVSLESSFEKNAQIITDATSQVIDASKKHITALETTATELGKVTETVIEKGNENIAQTNIVLAKLPQYIFELQKPIPLRRAHFSPKGNIIRPVTEE